MLGAYSSLYSAWTITGKLKWFFPICWQSRWVELSIECSYEGTEKIKFLWIIINYDESSVENMTFSFYRLLLFNNINIKVSGRYKLSCIIHSSILTFNVKFFLKICILINPWKKMKSSDKRKLKVSSSRISS